MKTIAIVGRPNVGKSRLFNRIIRRRYSIVDDTPGITRDRVEFISEGVRWIDTGGIGLDDDFAEAVSLQARVGIEAADAIIFVVDAQTGLMPLDRAVAQELRGKKPIVIAVNKADHPQMDFHGNEFMKLGFKEMLTISAEHGRGIEALIDTAISLCGDVSDDEDDPAITKVAIVGRPNVGKSSLLNAILGHDRAIVSPIAGTTRDAIEDVVDTPSGRIAFIDTAGIRKKRSSFGLLESVMVGRARKAVERSDVTIIVFDALEGMSDQDHKIISAIFSMGRGAVIALNKWDAVDKKEFDKVARDMRHKLKADAHIPIVSISALKRLRIPRLLEVTLAVGKNAATRITTGELNRILADVSMRAPSGLRIKYGIQKSIFPPTFVIFGAKKPPQAMVGYLTNSIRKAGSFEGVPIITDFRE